MGLDLLWVWCRLLKSSSSSEDYEQELAWWITKRLMSVKTINMMTIMERRKSSPPGDCHQVRMSQPPRLPQGSKRETYGTPQLSKHRSSAALFHVSTCRALKGFQNLPEVCALCFQGCQGEVLHPWCQPLFISSRSIIAIDVI